MFDQEKEIPNEYIGQFGGISLFMKREDLLHPEVSGNKFRKLKYNVERALLAGSECLLTFGGAYSNHIAATAAAGKLHQLKTVGVIRGEELGQDLGKTLEKNPTLRFAASCGMQFEFLSRSEYREKETPEVIQRLREKFGNFYLLPEGGTNTLAVKGCEEILREPDKAFDIICCPVGTGGTLAGIINASGSGQRILGFPALKGDFLEKEIQRFTEKNNWELIPNFHFGGYAKVNPALINFMNAFYKEYQIPLDPVYTGKMMYGIFQLLKEGYFSENTRILAVHTGGLQGIAGMNRRLKNKNAPQIEY